MADVAQQVRALDCGSGGRGFEPHHSPQVLQQFVHTNKLFSIKR